MSVSSVNATLFDGQLLSYQFYFPTLGAANAALLIL
jgi:hypothetical protein